MSTTNELERFSIYELMEEIRRKGGTPCVFTAEDIDDERGFELPEGFDAARWLASNSNALEDCMTEAGNRAIDLYLSEDGFSRLEYEDTETA